MHHFSGTWVTLSGKFVYRVLPKCACTTIGQALYFHDHGTYFDGDIHRAKKGMHRWDFEESRRVIQKAMLEGSATRFTAVRNPYHRLLSAFFDKICGIQASGKRYRGKLVPLLMEHYGVQTGYEEGGKEFDQIASFRRFLLFVRDTLRYRRPIEPDIHWMPVHDHLRYSFGEGAALDMIFATEEFSMGLQAVMDSRDDCDGFDVSAMPRFNESAGHGPKRAHKVSAYYDDLAMHMMHELYGADFALFNYDIANPDQAAPEAPIDLEFVRQSLAPKGG